MHQQQATGGPSLESAPEPLWQGEYHRIFRLMAAKLHAAAGKRRITAAATTSPEGVP